MARSSAPPTACFCISARTATLLLAAAYAVSHASTCWTVFNLAQADALSDENDPQARLGANLLFATGFYTLIGCIFSLAGLYGVLSPHLPSLHAFRIFIFTDLALSAVVFALVGPLCLTEGVRDTLCDDLTSRESLRRLRRTEEESCEDALRGLVLISLVGMAVVLAVRLYLAITIHRYTQHLKRVLTLCPTDPTTGLLVLPADAPPPAGAHPAMRGYILYSPDVPTAYPSAHKRQPSWVVSAPQPDEEQAQEGQIALPIRPGEGLLPSSGRSRR